MDLSKSSKIKGIRRITDKNFDELSADRPREANCKRILQRILLEHCQGLLVRKHEEVWMLDYLIKVRYR